jgi:Lrp/AsnC family transcriptional regulator, leucine-responsive regulatory protein
MRERIKLDANDREILKILTKDARTSIKEIANTCNISSAAVLKRIENLKATGVIVGTELRLKPGTLGYSYKASVGITADTSHIDDIAKSVREHPNVIVCAKSIGKYNMFCLIFAKSMTELDNATRTIKNLEGVKGIAINIWIDQQECLENSLSNIDE